MGNYRHAGQRAFFHHAHSLYKGEFITVTSLQSYESVIFKWLGLKREVTQRLKAVNLQNKPITILHTQHQEGIAPTPAADQSLREANPGSPISGSAISTLDRSWARKKAFDPDQTH